VVPTVGVSSRAKSSLRCTPASQPATTSRRHVVAGRTAHDAAGPACTRSLYCSEIIQLSPVVVVVAADAAAAAAAAAGQCLIDTRPYATTTAATTSSLHVLANS